ncbi:MAG: VCBS repeat-containing protein, partial [Saprospiraceae bacterium]|nr:VCBS repeat-containing protein [Saprospiraceae bacterium]
MKMNYLRLLFLSLVISFASHSLKSQSFLRVEDAAKIDHVTETNGVAVADYDQDGDLDIFFTGINNFNFNLPNTWNRLLQNQGDGTFKDVTVEAGFEIQYINGQELAARGEKMGVSWGDYDNDGFPDLFLANSREDQLFRNMRNGTFEDVTQTAGVAGCNDCYTGSGLWWDHDRDGDLDLYVSNLRGPNIMFENNGNGTFSDVTEQLDLAGDILGITWSSVAVDIGKDGILDLLNMNDTQENQFFENRGSVYNEAARAYRLNDEGACMGVAVGDYNNDGFFDIYITNIFSHHPNPLFNNLGDRRFADAAQQQEVDDSGWGWGTHFFDADHDGDEDL